MYVKFDALNRHEPLVMTLCNPGSVFEDGSPTKIIGIYADTSDEELQLKFNSESELSFRLYKVEREGEDDANEYTKLVFDSTEKKRLIFVNEIGYFMITEAEEGMDDDGTYYKDVKADSIEAEMRDRALIFIDDGTYGFGTLVDRIVDTVPNWTIGHVDSEVSARHRTFEDVDVEENVLGFLVEDMQDAFECIFLFDPIQRVINVYDQSNYVRTTDILISKNDVILGFEIKEDKDDLYTAIRAVGDDDLNIAAINPIGTNVLYDFTYYIDWMPEELAIKVSNWQDAVSDAEEEYYDLSLQYYDALGSKYTYTEEDAALNAQLTMYKRCRDNIVAECGDHQELVRGEPPKGTEEQVNTMLTKVTEHIKVLLAKYNSAIVDSGGDSIEIDDDVSIEAEVHETLAEIDRLIAETEESIHANEVEKRNSDEEVASLLSQLNLIRDSLSFENNFTDEELAELNSYVYEGTYSDDYVKVTEDMTHSEQFEQMKILYDRAKSTLKKASQPMKEFDIDVENFVFERAFENKTEQLETGCVIDVELHDDEITSLFLSEITVNYEDHKLSLKFGSQFSRFDPKSMFEDVLGNVKKSANTLDYIKDLVYPIKNGDFNVMKNALKTSRTITMDNALASTDQDVVIDVSGYTGRRIMEDGNIDPQQIKITNKNIVLTDDAWDSAKVAIGELFLGDGTTAYGVNAEVLMGDVIIGNQLHILNEDGNDVFQVTDEKLQSQYTRFSGDIDTLTTNYSRIEQTADNITLEVGRIQEDLDRKVETYSQPEAPASSGRVVGDIWIDSDDNNAMYRWDGNGWVSIRDGTIDAAQSTANNAYAMAQTAIQSVDVEYALGTSNTTAPAEDSSAWQTDSPTWEAGKYVWQRTATTANGVTTYSDPVCIQGASGQDGADGKGIDHITEYYAVSSSNTTAPSSGWTTTIQNTTTTNRYLWNYETITYSDNTTEDTLKRVIGTHGESGAASTSYSLIVSDAAIVKAANSSLSPSSITLTAKAQTGSGAVSNYAGRFKIETSTDLSAWTSVYTSSSNESSKTYTVPSGIRGIRCSLYLAGGTTTLLDQQTVPVVSDGVDGQDGTNGTNGVDGEDAYTVILANESHTFAAGTTSALAGSTECSVIAYKGATRVSATIGTISGSPTGMSTSVSSNGTTSAKFTVSVTTSMTTKNGVLTVPITVDGKSFTKNFTYSLAIKGEDGEDGVSVSSVTNYYLATSASSGVSTSTSGWTTTIQSMDATNQYLWNYEVATGSDNSTINTTDPVIIGRYGQDGTDGTNGRGIDHITEYYAVSSSNTTAPSSWQTTLQNTTTTNKYLWNYETVTYTDGTTEDTIKRVIGTHGATGSSSTAYSLIVSDAAIVKSQSGALSPSSIVLTAKSQTGTSAMANYSGRFKIETTTDMSSWTATYTSSANEATKSYTVPTGIKGIRCSLYLAGGTTTLLDQQTVPVVSDGIDGTNGTNGTNGTDGKDAYTVILTNESHTFAAGTSAAIAGSTECQVIAYKGATQVAATIETITGQPTGMTTSISSNNSTSAKFTVSVTTSMTTQNGVLTVPITVDGHSFTKRFTYSLALKGTNGSSATSYSLIVSDGAIVKSKSGTLSPASITLTAKSQTGTSAMANYSGRFKIETSTDLSSWTATYTSSGNEATKSYNVPSGIKGIRCSLYLAGGTTTLLDQQTVPVVSDGTDGTNGTNGTDGKDAYTVILTNESHTFAAGTSAAVAGSTECQVIAYKGATQVAATIGTISGAPTGMSTSISSNGSTSAKFTVSVTTSMTTKNGVLTVPITVDGKSFSKRFTYSLAITGSKGDQGVSVSTVTHYYLATSASSGVTRSTSGWTTTIQTMTATNQYLWAYEVVTGSNNSTLNTTDPVIIGRYGQNGTNGTDGISPTKFTEQYYLSTSSTSQSGGSWVETQPTWESGKYIWTRTKVSWSNNTTTYTDPVLAQAVNNASNVANRADIMARARRGVALFNDPDFSSGLNGCVVYNNSNNGNVTVTRVSSPSGTPTKTGYVLKISNTGAASPGIGGFICSFAQRANAEFVQIYKLLVPTGYTVAWAGNVGGDGRVVTSLTSMAGTGKWEEYAFYVKCGSSGSFSSAGHIYLSGTAGTTSSPVTWYCCSCQVYDISQTFNPNSAATTVEEQWAYGTASAAQSSSWSSSKVTPTDTYKYLWKRIKTTTAGGTVVYKPSENGVLSSEDSRARALIDATVDTITLGVVNSESSATIQMSMQDTSGETQTSNVATISMTGLVTLSSLESYSVGSRNMLKNSNRAISNANYNIATYYLDSVPIVNDWYTFTLRGTLASSKTKWMIYNSGGSVKLGEVTPTIKGSAFTCHVTFQWKNTSGSTTVTPTYVSLYAANNEQSGTSSIEWVTLTKGKNPSETWELCPSDLSGQNSTTTINGGNITTHTIDANRMNVSTLSSITANIGEVTAGLVRSNDGTTFFDLDNATLKTYSENTTPAFPWADLTFGYETQISNGVVTCHTGQYQSSNQFSYIASSYLSAQGLTIAGYPSDEAFQEANYRSDSQTIYSGSGEALGRSYGARVASYDMTLITHGGESSLNPYRVDAILGNAANAVMDHVRVAKQNWGTSLSVIVGAEATHGILMIGSGYFGFWWVAGNSGSMNINVQRIYGTLSPTVTFTETVNRNAFGRITVSVSSSNTITMFIHTTRKGIMAIAGGYMI